ncbi:Yip1 domain-containing protein [Gorgonomyces haynaldii]|nr:Yip1 domain-containing protein [Gorgonomyces haynaldii]
MQSENTLDEPVLETLKRDLKQIYTKAFTVLNPFTKHQNVLRDWDWWGPLVLCLLLSIRLSLSNDQGPFMFTATFTIIWFGSLVVTLNSTLLGGKISFVQSVCILGYCICPLVIASWLFFLPFFIRFILVVGSYIWSVYASLRFLTDTGLDEKKFLAVYPIFLFYFIIAWLILIV